MTKANLETLVQTLLAEISDLKERVFALEQKTKAQSQYIRQLEDENKDLKFKLNSGNSSLPPSTDITYKSKKNRSLRPKTKRTTGGQKGHKGSNLKMVSKPDKTIEYKISCCSHCDHNVINHTQKLRGKRQVYDIPPITMVVTEHRQYEINCPSCGHYNISSYPESLNKGHTQYGPNIQSLVTYLNIRQYMPMNRLVEFISVLTSQKMSEGTVYNMLRRSADRAQYAYEEIRRLIGKSSVVGSDESGCNVKGKKNWMWVYQTELYTYLKISPSRGYLAIQSCFPEGLQNSIIVSDCWAAQLKTPSKGKQVCLPHLVRNLNELIDRYQSKWAHQAKAILIDIMKMSQQKRILKKDKELIEEALNRQLERPLTNSKKKVKVLLKRLIKNKRYLTTCLYHRKVPADNNGSERAIRNMKVKSKVSGLFRSKEGADIYATLRSVVDTAIKQDISPFQALANPSIIVI